jgi:hypothetical protein
VIPIEMARLAQEAGVMNDTMTSHPETTTPSARAAELRRDASDKMRGLRGQRSGPPPGR